VDRNYSIAIAGYNLDPLDMSRSLPEGRMLGPSALERLEREPGYFIVQLVEPLTAETREELSARAGLILNEYIPNLAYVERLSPEERERLAQEPAIRAVVPFPPAFKLSPAIGSFEPRTEERAAIEGLYLRAILFDDAEPRAAAAALREAGARGTEVRDDRVIGGVARVHFTFDRAADLDAIAAIPEIRWVEEIGELIEDNVNAATTIQSGTAGTAPTWNRGLTGSGQIIGMIDSRPPDINHCFFQDPLDNTPGFTHRKIIDIRNGSGLAAGDHGTFVAGNAAGDDFNNLGASNARGGAFSARLVAGTTADVNNNTLLSELTAAAAMGAVIHTNSWHDNTAGAGNAATYNQNAADVDTFTFGNEDHLVVGSMGNNGEEQGPPGTAKNALGVNAAMADPNDNTIGDGNPGPTAMGAESRTSSQSVALSGRRRSVQPAPWTSGTRGASLAPRVLPPHTPPRPALRSASTSPMATIRLAPLIPITA
jgi:Subtilase family